MKTSKHTVEFLCRLVNSTGCSGGPLVTARNFQHLYAQAIADAIRRVENPDRFAECLREAIRKDRNRDAMRRQS